MKRQFQIIDKIGCKTDLCSIRFHIFAMVFRAHYLSAVHEMHTSAAVGPTWVEHIHRPDKSNAANGASGPTGRCKNI